MANLVVQGTLNRLKASAVFASYPALSVIASNLGKEGISVAAEGAVSQQLGTMTGTIPSPEPYQMITVTMHLLRTQALGQAYKTQIETDAYLGSMNVITDTSAMDAYQIEDASIVEWDAQQFNGTNPEFVVKIRGTLYINSTLWDAA